MCLNLWWSVASVKASFITTFDTSIMLEPLLGKCCFLKGQFTLKFCHYLHTSMPFQTCTMFLLWKKTKQDILKNALVGYFPHVHFMVISLSIYNTVSVFPFCIKACPDIHFAKMLYIKCRLLDIKYMF